MTPDEQRKAALVKECFRRSTKHQSQHEKAYRARYRAYRGILEKATDVWQSQLSPPYVFQVLETIFAMIASEHPRSRVLPEDERSIDGALALDKLIPQHRQKDKFDQKYSRFVRQALILGNSPMKTGWESTRATRQRRVYDQATGQMHTTDETVNIMDQNVADVIPADDFFWDPSVSMLSDSPYAIARWWIPLRELKNDPNYKNIDMLQDVPRGSDGLNGMKDSAIKRDRSGLIEVLEYWDSQRLLCVAGGEILIRDQPMPFWHGKLPFVMATPVPDIYTAEGLSETELIMDIQAAIWLFLNQRIDNTRLISNAIIMYRDTMDDPDKLVFEPGALWPVNDPGEVMMWTPNQNIGQASLEAENELKQDLLNITAAMEYLGGASSEMMQNNTATGVSIMANAAQGRVLAKRQEIYNPLKDKGEMEIANIQQFFRGPVQIRQPGATADSPYKFLEIHAQDVLCNACYDIEDATESMNRQERRDEAMQLFQVVVGAAPVFMQLGQPINLEPALENVLDAFDKKDQERWMELPQPAGMAGGAPGALPQIGPGAPNGNGAVPAGGGNPNGPPPPALLAAFPGVADRLSA